MTYDASSSLIGYQPLALAWQAVLAARNVAGIGAIFDAYDHWCKQYDIDPNLAFAQACHESAYFTSMRWTQEWNPAGLGIVANNTPPNPFKSPQEGIQAHIEHLLCYTHLIDDCPADHAHLADRRHFFHDGMPRLADLERLPARGWANPGTGYVDSIVSIANSIGGTTVSAVPTEADLGFPGQVHYATGSGETMDIANVQWFIVHDTEGGFAGSEATLSGQISAHLLIDKSGEWRFMVPLDTVAYSAGNLPVNRQSVNVEHVGFVDGHDGGYTDPQYRCCAAFFRFCRANGMTNVPAVYIGKVDVDGGPEPDVPGILGHMDVPRDDNKPGWGGNYSHSDPGPTYDFGRLINYIGAPPPPDMFVPDGNPHNTDAARPIGFGGAFKRLVQGTPYWLQTFGFPFRNEQQATVRDADGTSRQRTVQVCERTTLIYQPENAAPWDAVVALSTQKIKLL